MFYSFPFFMKICDKSNRFTDLPDRGRVQARM